MIKNITIPEYINQIKIDVGLAGEAPNSALWLSQTIDRFVIGIEPVDRHWDDLHSYTQTDRNIQDFYSIQLDKNAVVMGDKIICPINDRFFGIKGAIDNIPNLTLQKFYQMEQHNGSTGSSSLLKPTSSHPYKVDKVIEVETFPLEYILDLIDWDRFSYIEQIKTDCEGKDLDVVKSIGKYIDKIVFINSEATNNGHYWEGSQNNHNFIKEILKMGFKMINWDGGNVSFVNFKYKNEIIKNNLTNKTYGH